MLVVVLRAQANAVGKGRAQGPSARAECKLLSASAECKS